MSHTAPPDKLPSNVPQEEPTVNVNKLQVGLLRYPSELVHISCGAISEIGLHFLTTRSWL
jgi:hypothetical protein